MAEEIKDPQGMALFKKIKAAYENASSFSCEGQFSEVTPPDKDIERGNFKILYSRPDQIRIDWSDTNASGESFTNSIYTENRTVFFYWPQLGKWEQQKNMEEAIWSEAGISHGVSAAVTSLLLGQPGYMTFTKLKAPSEIVLDGRKCLLLAGTTHYQGDMELTVDPVTYVIRQYKTTNLIKSKESQKDLEEVQKEIEKTDPELAAKMKAHPHPNTPDFICVSTMTFQDPVFGKKLKSEDFIYPVPADAKKSK